VAVQCLILSSGLKDYGHLLALASYRKAPTGVRHSFCLTPTDEDSHSATIVVLCFAIVCICSCSVHLSERWFVCLLRDRANILQPKAKISCRPPVDHSALPSFSTEDLDQDRRLEGTHSS